MVTCCFGWRQREDFIQLNYNNCRMIRLRNNIIIFYRTEEVEWVVLHSFVVLCGRREDFNLNGMKDGGGYFGMSVVHFGYV